VSRGYVDRVNISNTRVNTTVINNVYNTTIVNNTTVRNVTYVNQRVPGAVMTTTATAFQSAQPVSRNRAKVDARGFENAPVRLAAPAIVPARQAFLGPRGPGSRPPQAVQSRVITARIRPPAAPLPIAAREQAIRADGGRVPAFKPTPAAEVRTPVRMAPPVKTLVSAPRVNETVSRALPAPAQVPAQSRPPVHVNELPPMSRGASPAEASSVLERQHLQEQQQLQAHQASERAQMQVQQEREHQQLQEQEQARQRDAQQAAERARSEQQAAQVAQQRQAQQQAADAQRQERERQIEAQHQQQTQQLAQEHARQQQEMAARQQVQQREQHVQAPPPRKPPTPPNQKQP
jgi:hypothetical protein